MTNTYAAAWRVLPRAERRAKVEAMYAELRGMSLQGLLDEITEPPIIAYWNLTVYKQKLYLRLAKCEILRRERQSPYCQYCGQSGWAVRMAILDSCEQCEAQFDEAWERVYQDEIRERLASNRST